MSIRDIQVFFGFSNFYQCFIQGYSRIATLYTLLLKATRSSNLALKAFKANDNKIFGVDDRANKMVVNLSKNKKSKYSTYMPNIETIGELNFLTSDPKKTFNHLQLALSKL